MSATLRIDVMDGASPALRMFITRLNTKTGMHRMMGAQVQNAVRRHMIAEAGTRHGTAARLGGVPTGFLGQAAEAVGRNDALEADESAATLALNHPAFARAFGDVTIRPRTKKFLTIGVAAESYGHTYYSVLRKYGVISKRTGKPTLPKRADGKRWFVYVSKVNQRQDSTLLPTDNTLRAAAMDGVADYVKFIRTRKGKA